MLAPSSTETLSLPLSDLLLPRYGNNCICSEHNYPNVTAHMQGDVNAVTQYGFNGIKLDGCGEFLNLTWWADLLNATGRPILIENCHWGTSG